MANGRLSLLEPRTSAQSYSLLNLPPLPQSPPIGQLSTAPVLWATSPIFAGIPQEEITQAVRTALAGLTRPAPQVGWGQIMKAALLSSLIPAGAGLLTGLISKAAGGGATPGAQVFAGLSPVVPGVVQGALTRAQWEQQQYAQQLQNYWNMLDFLSKIFTPYVPQTEEITPYQRERLKLMRKALELKGKGMGAKQDMSKYYLAEKDRIRKSLESYTNPYYDELVPLMKDKKLYNKYIEALAYYNLADYPDISPEKAEEYRKKANDAFAEVEKGIAAKKDLSEPKKVSLMEIISQKVIEFIKSLPSPPPSSTPPSEEKIEEEIIE